MPHPLAVARAPGVSSRSQMRPPHDPISTIPCLSSLFRRATGQHSAAKAAAVADLAVHSIAPPFIPLCASRRCCCTQPCLAPVANSNCRKGQLGYQMVKWFRRGDLSAAAAAIPRDNELTPLVLVPQWFAHGSRADRKGRPVRCPRAVSADAAPIRPLRDVVSTTQRSSASSMGWRSGSPFSKSMIGVHLDRSEQGCEAMVTDRLLGSAVDQRPARDQA